MYVQHDYQAAPAVFILQRIQSACLHLQARTDVFDDKQRSEHDFFEYVAKSYKYFLAGDDYQSQAVDDEIAQEAEDRVQEIRQRNQQLQQVWVCIEMPSRFACLHCIITTL